MAEPAHESPARRCHGGSLRCPAVAPTLPKPILPALSAPQSRLVRARWRCVIEGRAAIIIRIEPSTAEKIALEEPWGDRPLMEAMPRPRPPHLHRETTRHGSAVWYVRVGKGPRIRLRAAFGSPDFNAEYQMAVSGTPRPIKGAPATGTLEWLIARYRETAAWSVLSVATRRQRENIFLQVLKTAGRQALPQDRRGDGARRMRASVAYASAGPAFSRCHARAVSLGERRAQFVKIDPTAGIDNPERRKGDGFIPWTEEHVAAYKSRWQIGTRQRVWLDLLLYTGLRRGDAVRLGRQHVRDGVATIKTAKSNFTVTVTLPILPVLAETLAAGPCGDLTFIVGESGQPLTKESFGNMFREACAAAGVPGSAHGVRKIAATRAANAGATVAQLEAIFGWSGGRMASLYTRRPIASVSRLRRCTSSQANVERTSIPAPCVQVRAPAEKPNHFKADFLGWWGR